uniref:Uncharacterized protein n=1 Tax=Arundo donax TaxID=35708 RepID=A0A0A9HP24_ARUDO
MNGLKSLRLKSGLWQEFRVVNWTFPYLILAITCRSASRI